MVNVITSLVLKIASYKMFTHSSGAVSDGFLNQDDCDFETSNAGVSWMLTKMRETIIFTHKNGLPCT